MQMQGNQLKFSNKEKRGFINCRSTLHSSPSFDQFIFHVFFFAGFWPTSEMIPQTTEVSTDNTPSSSTGTFANTRISATLSERLSSYLASTPATHTTSSRPTIPPEETKMVNMEVTLNMEFRKEYNDVNSPIYTELVANLTNALIRVYKEVDGFLDVRVLFIRRGSIVCNYIVILASNSTVADDDLKNELEKGRKDGKFPFDVKGITVIEDSDAVAAKTKLPQWAMTTMIVLGALAFCFLVIAICACVSFQELWFSFFINYFFLFYFVFGKT